MAATAAAPAQAAAASGVFNAWNAKAPVVIPGDNAAPGTSEPINVPGQIRPPVSRSTVAMAADAVHRAVVPEPPPRIPVVVTLPAPVQQVSAPAKQPPPFLPDSPVAGAPTNALQSLLGQLGLEKYHASTFTQSGDSLVSYFADLCSFVPVAAFAGAEIDMDAFLLLEKADLDELKIPMGPRVRLLKAIADLRPSL